ncbi:MAG: thermonuclease family protein [Nanoarchaeota archaeon]
MNKKASFLLASMITLIIAGNYIFFADDGIVREKVEIVRVLDGDTVELADGRKVRLLNINTPEKGLSYSTLGKEYLSGFTEVELETKGLDKYTRTLGRLYSGDLYLNLEIVKQGFAHTYLVDESEERLFNNVEEYARENQLNIWERSEFYGCLDVEINKYDEYLLIEDSCGVNLVGWSVKDESTKSYEFEKDFGELFKLYSWKGSDDSENIYWGRENIWNDDHDEIFIRDNNGFLAYYYSYG